MNGAGPPNERGRTPHSTGTGTGRQVRPVAARQYRPTCRRSDVGLAGRAQVVLGPVLRSCQKRPPPGAGRVAASQTIVSAPVSGVAQQRTGDLVEQRQRRRRPRGVRPAGVHGVDGDPVGGPALLHQRGQPPASAWCGRRRLPPCNTADVLRVGAPAAAGRTSHPKTPAPPAHSRRPARAEQLGQQQRPQHVRGERELVAVRRLLRGSGITPALCTSTSTSGRPAAQGGPDRADVVKVGHVGRVHLDAAPGTSSQDVPPCGLTALLVAHQQVHGRAQGRPAGPRWPCRARSSRR